jgi:hypothetical protein
VRRLATFAPPLLVGLFALPFILHQNSWWEWGNAYWLLERQTAYVSAHGVPTLFLHNYSEAYNPYYVYYAGFTFSLLAYPAALFGAWPVFVASVIVAMAGGYLGVWWTARNLGLSPQLAILPGLTFATTPYVVSEIYGRGAWAELVAANAAAVVLGATTSLLWRPRPERSRAPAVAALIAATAVIAGTHNVSLMLSAILLPLILLALLPLRARAGAPPLLPEVGRVAAAVAVGIGLTAAWLLPNLWFGRSTLIAQPALWTTKTFAAALDFVTIRNLFSPLPQIPVGFENRWVYAQAPTLVAAWSLVAIAAAIWLRRRSPDRVLASLAGLLVVGGGLTVLIVHVNWWPSFPAVLQAVQFSYRLVPYLAIVVALVAIVGLTTLDASAWTGRSMIGILVTIVAVQTGAGIWIVVKSEAGVGRAVRPARHSDLTAESEPASFSSPGLSIPLQFHVVKKTLGKIPNRNPPTLRIADLTTSASATLTGAERRGDRMMVGVVWSPFVQITGDARIDGREVLGRSVIAVTNTDAQGRWHATVEAAHPWQLTVGRLISLCSAIIIVLLGVRGGRRRRRSPPPHPTDADPASDERAPAVVPS